MLPAAHLGVWTEEKRRIAQKELKYPHIGSLYRSYIKRHVSVWHLFLEYHQLRPTVHHSNLPHTDQISSQTNYPPW
jgi:hypothetical protein